MDSQQAEQFYSDPSFTAPEVEPEYKPEDFGPQPKFDATGRPIATMQDPNAPTFSAQEEYVKQQMQQAVPEGSIPAMAPEVAEQAGIDKEFVAAMQRAEANDFSKRMGLVAMPVPQRVQSPQPVLRRPQPQPQQITQQPTTQRYPSQGQPFPPGQPGPANGQRTPPPQQRNASIAPPRQETEPDDPRSLTDQLIDYARGLGDAEAAREFGTNAQTVRAWFKGDKAPLAPHLEHYLKIRAKAINEHVTLDLVEGEYSMGATRPKLSLMFCMPVAGQIDAAIEFCHMYVVKTYGVRVEIRPETMLVRARNILADKFLASDCEWCLTVDKDILFGIGNEEFMRQATQSRSLNSDALKMDAVSRILSHGQPFVGGLYAGRGFGSPLVIAPDMTPRSQADRDLADQIRQGQHRTSLVDVDWLAAGFLLIHRSVFEAIRKRFPELKSQYSDGPFNYWTPKDAEGEDVALSMRAKACGFVPKLDPGCVVGHIGKMCFLPEHTGQNIPMRSLH